MRARTLLLSFAATAASLFAAPSNAKGPRPMSYREMVRSWHLVPPDDTGAATPEGRPLLVLEMINTHERIELSPERDDGGFSAADLERASQALRDHKSGEVRPFDARTLDLAYRIQRRFEAPLLRVISAFRTRHGRHSQHSRGRALDFVVPGAKDGEVAKFARTMGFVGVGTYPSSGFVHIDSRARSYFWVDASAPGRRARTVPILSKLAASSDAKAVARGETAPEEDEGDSSHGAGSAVRATFTATAKGSGASAIETDSR